MVSDEIRVFIFGLLCSGGLFLLAGHIRKSNLIPGYLKKYSRFSPSIVVAKGILVLLLCSYPFIDSFFR